MRNGAAFPPTSILPRKAGGEMGVKLSPSGEGVQSEPWHDHTKL